MGIGLRRSAFEQDAPGHLLGTLRVLEHRVEIIKHRLTWGYGAEPSIQGVVPGTHMLFGGDEWWFFGPRIYPGDHLVCHRMPFDYKVRDPELLALVEARLNQSGANDRESG